MFVFLFLLCDASSVFSYEASQNITPANANSNFFLASIPKCGTNLLQKCVEAIVEKNGKVASNDFVSISSWDLSFAPEYIMTTHNIASEDNIRLYLEGNFKGIFIYRDPRDQIVSFALYINTLSSEWPDLWALSLNDRISHLIKDASLIFGPYGWTNLILKSLQGIDSFYYLYLPWMKQEMVYTTTFEKLVGKKGLGSDELQFQEIKNIALHLGYDKSYDEIRAIQENLFGGTKTFREGKIGSWKEYFTEEHKKIFKKIAGQLLIDLGYEKDLNW